MSITLEDGEITLLKESEAWCTIVVQADMAWHEQLVSGSED